jgi:hypothetical protein
MEEFALANFRGSDLVSLNICRMILHSVTLADICTVDGKAITLDAWQGQRDHSSGKEYSWPRVQSKLPSHYWELWQKALRLCFLVRGVRMGPWTRFPPHWQWFYSPQEDRIYKQEGWMWRPFSIYGVPTSLRLGAAKYRSMDELTRVRPADLRYASVNQSRNWVTKVATTEVLERKPHPTYKLR